MAGEILKPVWYGIVFHHTACKDTAYFEGNPIEDEHLAGGWLDIGYHLVIEQIGPRYWAVLGRPLTMPGAHAPGFNRTHIGVAFVGNFDLEHPKPELLVFAAPYVQALVDGYHMKFKELKRHDSVYPTKCPGRYFDLDAFKTLLKEG